jgi:hypothetical protein
MIKKRLAIIIHIWTYRSEMETYQLFLVPVKYNVFGPSPGPGGQDRDWSRTSLLKSMSYRIYTQLLLQVPYIIYHYLETKVVPEEISNRPVAFFTSDVKQYRILIGCGCGYSIDVSNPSSNRFLLSFWVNSWNSHYHWT